MTPSVLDNTADEKAMLNYNNRTIEPIVSAIVNAMKRSFLSKTARTQGQTIKFFRDPFKLMTVSEVAESADALTRNEIMSSNEFRQIIGLKPSDDPKADELRNSNLNHPDEGSNNNNPVNTETTPDNDDTYIEPSTEKQAIGELPIGTLISN